MTKLNDSNKQIAQTEPSPTYYYSLDKITPNDKPGEKMTQ